MQGKDFKIRISDFPQKEKPRERLVNYGPTSLSNWELIAILLGTGNKNDDVITLSHQIISGYRDINHLSTAKFHELLKFKGLGKAKTSKLLASFELARRINKSIDRINPKIKSPADYFNIIKDEICTDDKEKLVVFCINSRNRLICYEIISIGTVNQALIHPREVFKPAFINSATSITIAHNHPSGDPNPSQDDFTVTERLVAASRLIGVELNDHIIITANKYYSMRESGHM